MKESNSLPFAPEPPDKSISQKLSEIGQLWARSNSRPRILPAVAKHWDGLIDEWAESDLPLVIRKGGGIRGGEIRHPEGRNVILADNSPAQWAFTKAFERMLYTLNDITNLIRRDIPFAFATKTSEKDHMTYKRTLAASDNLNKRGWKLCHVSEVGLRTNKPISQIPIEMLKDKFRLLLKPSNLFLVPLKWAGLGELDEVIAEIRNFESLGAVHSHG